MTGTAPAEAAQQVHRRYKSDGINAAHRSTPLAAFSFIPDEQLPEIAKVEASITHLSELSIDTSIAVNVICRNLIHGKTLDESLQVALSSVRSSEIKQVLSFQYEGKTTAEAQLDRDGFAPRVLKAALYFLKTNNNFRDALEKSLLFAGSANYCPVLVGSIGGALYGDSSVTPDTLRHVNPKLAQRLSAVALQMK